MKYDFTSIIDRQGKDAIAIDMVGKPGGFAPDGPKEGWDVIPMWIADMNFETVPTIPEAIIERTKHPLYGYFSPTEAYFNSIIKWQGTRNGVTGLLPEHIGYGEDEYCELAREIIRKKCGAPDAYVQFLVGGTQTNTTVMLNGTEGIFKSAISRPVLPLMLSL